MVNKIEYKGNKIGTEALKKATGKEDGDDPTVALNAAREALKTSIGEALKKMEDNKKDDGDKIFNAIVNGKEKETAFITQIKEVIDKTTEFLGKGEDEARKGLEDFKKYVNDRSAAKDAVNKHLKHIKKDNKGYVDAALDYGKKADVDLAKSITGAGIDKVKSESEAKTKTENYLKSDEFNNLSSDSQNLVRERTVP